MQSEPITIKVVISNPVHGGVYSIQHDVIKFVSDLRQVGGFLQQVILWQCNVYHASLRCVRFRYDTHSAHTKDSNFSICCISAKQSTLYRVSAKTGWLGIRKMCLSGETCLSAGRGYSELALWKSYQSCWTSITISLEMPVPSQGHYGFHSFPVVDWFCLFI